MTQATETLTWRHWTVWVPVVSLVALAATWGQDLSWPVVVVVASLLVGAVLAAVHHAEVVAHRVGEPFGSLVLAVAVTLIEVALIVTLMVTGGSSKAALPRETVFAALMITMNGMVGLSLLAATKRAGVTRFNAQGAGGALATIVALATLTLVLPTFTTSSPGPTFTGAQLAFAAVASLALYGLFVFVQTVRHRDYFLPKEADGTTAVELHADPPSDAVAIRSLVMLVVSLVSVVGLAKTASPTIESGIVEAGLPVSAVGVVIALLVLLPEGLAAIRAARRSRFQISLNLSYGSAMASIGLTVPTIAFASIWIDYPLQLGLGPVEIVLLALTAVVSALTVAPGRATLLQAGVHLSVFAAFLLVAVNP